jgi:cobalamin biosynthesis protein CobD/CbiB
MLDLYSWLGQTTVMIATALVMLVLAIILDLVLGDPSPNYPDRLAFKLHPTVVMGNFTKKIEPYFKNPKVGTEKFLGVLLGLTVIAAFALPTFFGLWGIYTFLPFYLNIIMQ